ncbi:MAG TPA: helicase-related protein, partial [Bacteroidales bacterium]|nr:helicase-related protein [Bacteroidales bacterium]
WGYDFRPPYLRIADIRQLLPDVPVLALTATATAEVVTDIQAKLGFKSENVFRKSFLRKNLVYAVLKEEDKLNRLLRMCNRVMGSGIVYVRNRRRTREISDFLLKNKIVSDYYHAGLETPERNRKQAAWISGKIRIMVCTNAFGMGIDKPNVRLVVHMDLPDSLEAYFQEAGRAGRDENKSWAVLLFDQSDITDLKDNLALSYPQPDKIREVYQALGNYCQLPAGSGKGQSFNFELLEFCRQYRLQHVVAFNALKILEKEGYILLDDSSDSPSLLHVKCKKEDLYRFQVEKPQYDPFIKLLLRSYTGLFTTFAKINEAELARRGEMELNSVISMLSSLQKYGLIVYVPRRNKPQIIFTTQRFDSKNVYFTDKHYFDRYKASAQRIASVIDYAVRTDRCRSQILLDYFNETGSVRCGECDACKGRNKMEMSDLELKTIIQKIETLLQKQPLVLDELISNTPDHKEDQVLKALQWLLDNDRITHDSENRYRLNLTGSEIQ